MEKIHSRIYDTNERFEIFYNSLNSEKTEKTENYKSNFNLTSKVKKTDFIILEFSKKPKNFHYLKGYVDDDQDVFYMTKSEYDILSKNEKQVLNYYCFIEIIRFDEKNYLNALLKNQENLNTFNKMV